MFDLLNRLPPGLLARLETLFRRLPPVETYLEGQYDAILAEAEDGLHPYRREHVNYTALPATGRSAGEVLAELRAFADRETGKWVGGQVSGAVYHGDPAHIAFLNEAYALHSQSNPLHADVWPSTVKFEAEIVAMTAAMLGAAKTGDEIVGTVTSGGTESILLAMLAYRERARTERGISKPELVAPATAHAAFDKAARYFGIKLIKTPVGPDFRADVAAMGRAVGRNTIALVGSAPSFPHGVVDPIGELALLAQGHGIGLHVDACLGGFVLPFAARLGAPVPPFDFGVPGVTSMSVDTHKYGYALKGTSVVLYRGKALRRQQYFAATEWPGGLYFSPTLAGSRPGGLSAACWAAMVAIGEEGYLQATARILAAARFMRAHIENIPELQVLGDPLWVIAFDSPTLNIYEIMARMGERGWSLNGLHHPPAVHIAVTLRHAQPGVAQRFIEDLRASVAQVQADPAAETGMAPVYGLAAGLPLRGVVRELLKRYVDLLYAVPGDK
jgi:glutamate/tyrosine decarboxylase-like PLP-dependent enzyme